VFKNVISAMVDTVLIVDADGQITLTNTAAETLSGYTGQELRGMPVGQLLADNDDSGLRTVVRRRIEEGDPLRREHGWLLTRSGERIPVSVTASAVLKRDGSLQGIVLVARDTRETRQLLADNEAEIGRRRTAEEELRAVNASIEEQLEQTRVQLLLAERRATLGTLAGGVGHELRNIAQIQVAAIDELANGLTRQDELVQVVKSVLPDLARVSEHITAHGQRLMQLARPGPDHVAPIDLNAVVRDVIAMLRGAGKLRRIETVLNLGSEPLKVTVNRTRIEQILVNLVVNAIDAIGSGPGTITIDARGDDDNRVICEVRDTGAGIEPDLLRRIFEPFFTTKPEDRGTGLGLPVAREIVQSYGGALTVNSHVGSGTTFTFDLPR
jgi:PAS domain S-box-containing protein